MHIRKAAAALGAAMALCLALGQNARAAGDYANTEYDTNVVFTVTALEPGETETVQFDLTSGLGYLQNGDLLHIAMPGDSYTQTVTVTNATERVLRITGCAGTPSLTLDEGYWERYGASKGKDRGETEAYFWSDCFLLNGSGATEFSPEEACRAAMGDAIAPGDTAVLTVDVAIDGPKTTNVYQLAEIGYACALTLTPEEQAVPPPEEPPRTGDAALPMLVTFALSLLGTGVLLRGRRRS